MSRLPLQCEVRYQANFLSEEEAARLYSEIVSGYDVKDKSIRMSDGTHHIAETGTYLFADPELTSFDTFPEVWGGRSPWPASLAHVRDRIFQETANHFRVARCVYYADGSEGMDFHSDPPAYGDTSVIASLSLGAEREFVLRKTAAPDERHSIRLAPGSLLLMGKGCQELYEHALPRDERCLMPRLNLTFRKFGWN